MKDPSLSWSSVSRRDPWGPDVDLQPICRSPPGVTAGRAPPPRLPRAGGLGRFPQGPRADVRRHLFVPDACLLIRQLLPSLPNAPNGRKLGSARGRPPAVLGVAMRKPRCRGPDRSAGRGRGSRRAADPPAGVSCCSERCTRPRTDSRLGDTVDPVQGQGQCGALWGAVLLVLPVPRCSDTELEAAGALLCPPDGRWLASASFLQGEPGAVGPPGRDGSPGKDVSEAALGAWLGLWEGVWWCRRSGEGFAVPGGGRGAAAEVLTGGCPESVGGISPARRMATSCRDRREPWPMRGPR